MDKLNLDNAIDDLVVALRAIEVNGTKVPKVHREFIRARELPLGDYPVLMVGLESSAVDSQQDTGDVLLVCLTRSRDFDSILLDLRYSTVILLKDDFGSESAEVADIEFGDLMPGFTESAESAALPDGAFLASWLGVERPARGFFVRFTITVDTD